MILRVNSHAIGFPPYTLLTPLYGGRGLTVYWLIFTLLSLLLAGEAVSSESENLKIGHMLCKLLVLSPCCDKECPKEYWTLALALCVGPVMMLKSRHARVMSGEGHPAPNTE